VLLFVTLLRIRLPFLNKFRSVLKTSLARFKKGNSILDITNEVKI
jgi:hypothetical protein